MPLLIDLKPGEKVIINGAVIENAGANTKIRICNDSNLLREKEILLENQANSPATRVYFCLQNAYIFSGKRSDYLGRFEGYLSDYLEACPSAADIGKQIRGAVADGQYYKALKGARKLVKHEAEIIRTMFASAESPPAQE